MIQVAHEYGKTANISKALTRHCNDVVIDILEATLIEGGALAEDILGSKDRWEENFLQQFFPEHYPTDKVNDKIEEIYKNLLSDEKVDADIVTYYFINEIIDGEIRMRKSSGESQKAEMDKDIKNAIMEETYETIPLNRRPNAILKNYFKMHEDMEKLKTVMIRFKGMLPRLDAYSEGCF